MAFLAVAVTRLAIRGIKDGVQAHKDAKDPGFGTGQEREVEVDRWGKPKKSGVVYDFVLKKELQRRGKISGDISASGVAGPSDNTRDQVVYDREYRQSIEKSPVTSQGEDYGPQDYSSKGWNVLVQNETHGDAPPAYVETASSSSHQPQPRGAFGPAPTSASYSPVAPLPARQEYQRQDSLSSVSSSSSSGSSEAPRQSASGQSLSRHAARKIAKKEKKAEKKMEKNERRALKREHRNEKERMKVQHRYEKDMARSGVTPMPRPL